MANIVGTLVKGRMIRVTKLQEDGSPYPTGTPDSQLVTKGFISLSVTGNTTDQSEISVQLADGSNCLYIPGSSSFANYSIEIGLCGVDPQLLGTISNADPYQDYGGDDAGILVTSGVLDKTFALEIWTSTYGMPGVSGYILLPYVQAGVFGGFSLTAENAADFTLSNINTLDGTAWGSGPYDVAMDTTETPAVAAPLPTDIPTNAHLLMLWSSAPVPAPTDGLAPMP